MLGKLVVVLVQYVLKGIPPPPCPPHQFTDILSNAVVLNIRCFSGTHTHTLFADFLLRFAFSVLVFFFFCFLMPSHNAHKHTFRTLVILLSSGNIFRIYRYTNTGTPLPFHHTHTHTQKPCERNQTEKKKL